MSESVCITHTHRLGGRLRDIQSFTQGELGGGEDRREGEREAQRGRGRERKRGTERGRGEERDRVRERTRERGCGGRE